MDEARMSEAPGPMAEGRRRPGMARARRKELIRLAEEAATWMEERGVLPHERCAFRRLVELLIGDDL